ncbi:MAG: tRNA (adenine-N1)-methyltransferase [Chloroflexi bacterium]|nr:tRNA (adenine-N1)-methyltransferase [Chloroflexota bacterium]
MTNSPNRQHVFQEGDYVIFLDRRGRRYLARLDSSKSFNSHVGGFPMSELIGREVGAWVTTNRGHLMLAMKPTLADFVLEMPRIATIGYPKDLGAILVYGDIFPGARVLEAGAGSGAITMALMRAVGERGHVYSYDVREDMIKQALANVRVALPGYDNLTIKLGDVYQGIEEDELDRIVLDLPEPWHVVPHAAEKLVPGGILVSFLPTVLQVHDLTNALRQQGTFEMIETFEVLMRPWNVAARSVRPEHRMVAHTGFITTARKCSPRPSRAASDDNEDNEQET